MGTVIGVHGTFAHGGGVQSTPPETQWWEPGSVYEAELRALVCGDSGTLDVERFQWSGDNSELGRRKAGRDLLKRMRALEEKQEPYVLVGHSHGGSVISAALLASAARKDPLPHLKRWITIGTPFVKLQKERFLFTRLGLINKVLFIASMMLLVMFLINLAASFMSGQPMLFGRTFPGILVVTGVMMGLPTVLFYLWFYVYDSVTLLNYRSNALKRARDYFGPRWLSLAHPDDEAIQGLAFLPEAKLSFFDKNFAVSAITIASVAAVPILYLTLLTSPAAMVRIADWLDTKIYDGRASPEAIAAVRDLQVQLQAARDAFARQRSGNRDAAPQTEDRRKIWREYRAIRQEAEARIPDLRSAERTLRFRQRFFERDGKPCEGGKLCGGGDDLRYNSGLLLHVVTDELSWSIGAADQTDWRRNVIWSLVMPAVLVPVIFGLLSLAVMFMIQFIATQISHLLSLALNRITNAEVKRAAFGNDTEGEVAVGGLDRPIWLDRSRPRLPSTLSEIVTAYSNGMAIRSLAKFRRTLGQLALAEPTHTANSAVTTYFTWKELVHAAYFDVPEFRKLVMLAVSRTEGFTATAKLEADSDTARIAQWLAELETAPGTTATPEAGAPGVKDAAAVSAAIASTVKAEP